MASASVGAKDASGGGRRRTFAAPVLPLLLPTQRPPPGLPLMSLLVFFLVLLDTQYGSCRLAFVSPQQQSVEALPSLPPIPAAGGLVGRSATRRATGPGVPSWGAPTKGLLRIEATSPQSVQFSASDADECKVAAEAAATPPPDESPASAGGEVAALDGRRQGEGEEAPPRLSISKRRAEDRRMNWHRQYIYGPVDPTAALRREAATAARSESSQPPEILLQLAPQRRPSGRRWRLLEELEAGEEVRLAASAAAKDALDGICAAQQDRGAHGGPRRKSRASGGQTETVSLQTHMRRAALRAAAEAIEKEFYNMQRNPEGDSPPLGATTWDGGSSVTDAGDQEAPKVERRGLGPRTVYAAELRRLLLHRAALAAAEPLHGTGGGGAALAASKDATSEAAEGRPSLSTAPRVVSAATPAATEAASQSKGKSAGSKGNSKRLPLLDALLPREGVTYRPSSGLLTCQLLCTAGFDETIEVHVHLKRRKIRDGRIVRAPQRVQGFVTLPHGVIPSLLSGTGNLNAEAPAVGAREVRGKTRGGIWRRPRVIAALVEPGDEAAAKAAGRRNSNSKRLFPFSSWAC